MKRVISFLLASALLMCLCACDMPASTPMLNGTPLSEFTIVYDNAGLDYNKRAAAYIQAQIQTRTGITLTVSDDDEAQAAYEIVVGETSREISSQLNAETVGPQFAILASDNQIALEGQYFTVAAAAYYFVETYITDKAIKAEIPKEVTTHDPIVKEAKNVILMIGDGMGQNQTKIFDYRNIPLGAQTDGEDLFYGYLMGAAGLAKTNSLSGTTDSAAGGTALATGYKTNNGFVGQDQYHAPQQSLTELAASLNKATAIMSTDAQGGATPAAFSAHADDRYDDEDIATCQKMMTKMYGTRFSCGLASDEILMIEKKLTTMLNELSAKEEGFFLMYEEGGCDGAGHKQIIDNCFTSILRFNQVIGLVMEYAFYNPETFVLITADHETGNLYPEADGTLAYHQGTHSGNDVPVFAYGYKSECFNGQTMENVQIAKTIAKLWGIEAFGQKDPTCPALF